jgi:hypothetical protein
VNIYSLHFRRYAPFDKFGFPSFKGDKRTHASTSLTETSRTHGCVVFSRAGILKSFGESSGTHDANLILHFLEREAVGKVSINAKRTNLAGPALLGIKASTSGSNPLMPGSPDIDTSVELSVDWGMPSTLRVSGSVSGDDFPNLEVFLRCRATKKSVLIVDGRTTRGPVAGPISLFGSGGKLCSFSTSIPLDASGNFVSNLTCSMTKM